MASPGKSCKGGSLSGWPSSGHKSEGDIQRCWRWHTMVTRLPERLGKEGNWVTLQDIYEGKGDELGNRGTRHDGRPQWTLSRRWNIWEVGWGHWVTCQTLKFMLGTELFLSTFGLWFLKLWIFKGQNSEDISGSLVENMAKRWVGTLKSHFSRLLQMFGLFLASWAH